MSRLDRVRAVRMDVTPLRTSRGFWAYDERTDVHATAERARRAEDRSPA